MRKKIIKWILASLLGLLIILAGLDAGLHFLSRTDWFNMRVTNALQQTLGREFNAKKMGANLRGIFVEKLTVAEQGGFENGTFLEAGRLWVRVSLLHLLHGHVKITAVGLADTTAQLIKKADGTLNVQDLLANASAEQTTAEVNPANETTSPLPLRLTVSNLRLENLHLVYTDESAQRTLETANLTVAIHNFGLDQEFTVSGSTRLHHTQHETRQEIPLQFKAHIHLGNLHLPDAYVKIDPLTVYYQNARAILRGRMDNFEQPQMDFKLTAQNLSSEGLSAFTALPAFELPELNVAVKAVANPAAQTVTLNYLALEAPGTALHAQGGLIYQAPLRYDVSADGKIDLADTTRWFNALRPYELMGTLTAAARATEKQLSADVTLQEVGGLLPQAGRFSNLSATATAQEQMDFKHGKADISLSGKLNGHPLTAAVKAVQQPEVINVDIAAQADELVLPPLQAASEAAQAPAEQSNPWPLPPIRITSDIKIGKANVPYFAGTDVNFTADLHGITPDLKQAQGNLHLVTGQGTIQDLYKLTDANPLTKVLFLSLNVTGRVFNTLNVFGVLKSIGGGISSALTGNKDAPQQVHTQTVLGPDGEPMEIVVEPTDNTGAGTMDYDKFDTEVNFAQGVATVKKGMFVSTTMSLRLDGTTDFNTGALDLTVHAAPGRHEADGMMPLTLKIGGTIDNPQGNMQLLGSVSSLVTQSVTNNAVSRTVGKGIKGIIGLFKNDEEEPAPEEN